jgi:hypothetical protein
MSVVSEGSRRVSAAVNKGTAEPLTRMGHRSCCCTCLSHLSAPASFADGNFRQRFRARSLGLGYCRGGGTTGYTAFEGRTGGSQSKADSPSAIRRMFYLPIPRMQALNQPRDMMGVDSMNG